MLLSHYEILACGTALWKLLDLTVFAQGLLINSPLNDGVCPKQTAHVTDERERQRAKGKLTGPERQATTALLLFTEEVYPVCLFMETDSLSFSFWLDGATTPHHLTAPIYSALLHVHLFSFLSHQLPAHCHLIYSGSVGFLVFTTHFPDLVHWPLPQYTQWL